MLGPPTSSPAHNAAGYTLGTDSHLLDGKTEAWKNGVSPGAPRSTVLLSGEDRTKRKAHMVQQVPRVQERSPELGAAGNGAGE